MRDNDYRLAQHEATMAGLVAAQQFSGKIGIGMKDDERIIKERYQTFINGWMIALKKQTDYWYCGA